MLFDFWKTSVSVSALVCATLTLASLSPAQTPSLQLTRVASGLTNPLYATYAPGDSSRLFVLEQAGNIKILNLGSGAVSTFMTAADLSSANGLTTGGERGLLGMAFDPNYATNRRFYLNYTGGSGQTVVRSFVTQAGNPNLVDGNNGAANILSFTQPFSNHNGGWMSFGPDNQLYIASGDGGSGNDPNNNALNRNSLLGKMLRITPNASSTGGYTIPTNNPLVGVAGTRAEIWAYGLRNPWRNSFDRQTGDLYIGDVGQNAREEINFQAANSAGGQNYGWRQFEGTASTGLTGQPGTAPDTKPIFEYLQSTANGRSVTGGYVYRGPLTALQGQYFYGDFVGRTLKSFQFNGSAPSSWNGTNVINQINWTSIARDPLGNSVTGSWASFAEDANGNLYAIDYNGNIYQFTAATIPEPGMVLLLAGASTTTPMTKCVNENRLSSTGQPRAFFMARQ
jgi:glucose/arabinose dehydrogenase